MSLDPEAGRLNSPDAPLAEHLEAIERAAVQVARAAGERALLAFRSSLPLEFKGSKQDDPVTAADREIEAFLRTELQARFPDHGVVGEEQEEDVRPDAPFVWALDPLDGTANFASGLPLWGISLGLLYRGVPVVGCVWVPVGPSLGPGVFHARAGGGARFEQTPIAVADGDDQRGRLVALPGRYWRAFRFRRGSRARAPHAQSLADPRSLGSITSELTMVAAGLLRLAIFVQPRIWDVAAGALVVQEAGGSALTWRDGRWEALAEYRRVGPPSGDAAPSFRHWSQPVIVGSQQMAEQAASRLAWHPRLPKQLRRLLGIGG